MGSELGAFLDHPLPLLSFGESLKERDVAARRVPDDSSKAELHPRGVHPLDARGDRAASAVEKLDLGLGL
jgi:hypothetical protein